MIFLTCVHILSHSFLKSVSGEVVKNDDDVFGSSDGRLFPFWQSPIVIMELGSPSVFRAAGCR